MLRPADPILDTARRFYESGGCASALAILESAEPGPERSLLAGACLARLRRTGEAVSVFSELLRQDPDHHGALTWMALLLPASEGLAYARRAIELRPEDATGHGVLGTLLLRLGQFEEAAEALRQAINLNPEAAEHRHNLALALLRLHQNVEAEAQLRKAIELDPSSPQNPLVLARTLLQFGRAGQALDVLLPALERLPDSASLHTAVADAFAALRNDEAAESHHRRAAALSPEARGSLGAWLLNQGRFAESDAAFRELIASRTDPAYGYYGLMQSRKKAEEGWLDEMADLLHRGRLRPMAEMRLHYALAKAAEGEAQYQEAMAYYDAANRLAQKIYHGGKPIDPARFATEMTEARKVLDLPGHPSEAPIFIVGMIRSGTTLLDQIVSSHPDVASGGELRFWLEESRRPPESLQALAEEYVAYARLLAGPKPRFTDKMPLNFEHLGLIHRALPNARFLHIRRHPVDTALSIWTTFFGQGPLFAYDKTNIVAYYRAYLRQMEHWRRIVPSNRLYELDYEDLIASPETVVPQVIEFLGLPWNDACLRHDQNTSAINTPSRWQARQPIYRTSVERWRRYEPWLGEFASLLEAS